MKNFRQSAILVVFLLIMMSGSAFAQITNANVLTPANYNAMVPPAAGATYADSVFGTTIHRVTDALNMPNHDRGGSLKWAEAEYATMSPFNSDNSRFILIHESYFGLYDGATGTYLSDLPLQINSSSEPRWSRKDNVTLYYHDDNQLKSYNIKTGAITILHTFSEYKSIYGSGEMDISADGDHLVFAGDNEFIFVYEISTDKKYSVFDARKQNFDSLYITSDNQVIVSWEVSGTGRLTGQELFDINMNFLRQVGHADGHKDLTVDTDGSAVLVWTNSADPNPIANCQNGIVKIRLSDAKQTCLAQLDWSLAVHISAPDGNGTVFVDTELPSDQEPNTSSWKAYTNEIIQIKLDGSGAITRWVHHRSRPSGNYNWQPKLSVSRDGTHLVYSSNFNLVKAKGESALYGDTYMMVVPATGTTPVTPTPVTTAPVKPTAPIQPIVGTSTPDVTTTVRYEQDNAAVKYTGTWYPNSAAFNSGSSATLAMDANTGATVSFTGTSVKWIGFSDPWSGIAQVYIDGALKATVDTYSANQLSQTVLYSATNLTNGPHTMTVMSTGTHSTASGGSWVWVDAFDVTTVAVSTPVTTRYEQTNNAVTYNGAWYTNSGAFNSAASAAMGMDASATATISFTGTSVNWIGFSDPWSGIAKVFVDGTLAATVDTYSATQASQKVLFAATGLSNGPHTLSVMATGTHSAASGGAWVWVDAFDVTSMSGTASTTSLFGSSVQAASPVTSTTRLQQDNAAVALAGAWYANNGAFNSGQSAAMAMDTTASATISFTGTAVKWVGFSDPWSGTAQVYVDGVLTATVDTYAAVQTPQNVLYTATGLANGAHTLKVVPTGSHSAASAGSWIWVDAFDVTSIASAQVSTGTQLISSR